MTNYTINHIEVDGHTYWTILNNDSNEYFNGYDFMGSVNWTPCVDICYWMSKEEAMEICRDLNLADESAEPETKQDDPQIKSLQIAMDYAWNRRNDEHNALENIRKNGPDFMLDKQYAEYRASQAFYEGICMAIFAAGYTIRTDDHETGKSTVLKK